jgi:beta-glucosidase
MGRSIPIRILLTAVLAMAAAPLAGRPAQAARHFYWGVATSGFQSEGSPPDSNWNRYVAQHTAAIKDPYRNAVDFRHRYPRTCATPSTGYSAPRPTART